ERFRPVNLYTGTDGAMYVLDMYRGIIQHKTYLTPYLKNEIRMRNLTLPLNCGRIYRIVPASGKRTETAVGTDPQNLVKLLSSENGTIRDLAQQTIIDLKAKEVAPSLRELLGGSNAVVATHALWTLEGLNMVTTEEVLSLLKSGNRMIRAQALAVIPSVISANNQSKIWPALTQLQNDSADAIKIALLLGSVRRFNPSAVSEISNNLLKTYPKSLFIADAIIGGAENREDALATAFRTKGDTTAIIYKRLEKLRKDIANKKNATQIDALTKMYPRGGKVFTTVCQTCHGSDGEGIQSLAPPLNKSNWVTGSPDQLSRIVLYGLTGPVDVNGKLYKAPEINGDMPGIGSNDEFNDEDIAQLMSFLRSAWSNKASKVSVADVQKVRKENKDRQKPFTMQELNSTK
ncbi:MAG: c-type cytochrome, partial [Chitinophagaceae bacterium]